MKQNIKKNVKNIYKIEQESYNKYSTNMIEIYNEI